MKILVIQLARLGDIYLTWPTVRALKRKYPSAEIHLLVRERFSQATRGLEEIDHLWTLDTKHQLEKIFAPEPDLDTCLDRLKEFTAELKNEKFDKIVNLSFSSFSSYLTHNVSQENAEVSGYTRHSDGFLSLPDDGSAYFYAQVGLGKYNRIHLAEIFSNIAGVDLEKTDWCSPGSQLSATNFVDEDVDYVVVHIAASERKKSYPDFKWRNVLQGLLKEWSGSIVLIGAADDKGKAERIVDGISDKRILNLVGQTQVVDLFSVIKNAKLLIGCDSGPIHVASLANTPCLNLSFDSVSFWETGPRASGSRVIYSDSVEGMASDRVVVEAMKMLRNEKSDSAFELTDSIPCYQGTKCFDSDFRWQLIQALYVGGLLPIADSKDFVAALAQLKDVNEVFLQQFDSLKNNSRIKNFSQIVNRAEEVVNTIGKLVPDIQPLISWYQTEKTRIGPMDMSLLIERTTEIHQSLDQVLDTYIDLHKGAQDAQI